MSNAKYIANLADTSKAINFYFSAYIVPIGIVLNIFSIFIFLRRKFNSLPAMRFYYIGLAIYDILALSNSIFFIQLFPYLNINFTNTSEFACKFLMIWRRAVIQSPSWVLVAITLDRFKSVYFPTRFKIMEKRFSIILVLFSVYFFIFLINIPHIWFYLKTDTKITAVFDSSTNKTLNQTTKTTVCTATALFLTITDVTNVLMRAYFPFLLMLTFNVLLTKKFLQSKKGCKKK